MQTIELDRSVRGFGLAADHVEERCFPRTVRSEHDMQLVLLNVEVKVADRLETIERNRQVFNGQDHLAHFTAPCRSRSHSMTPARPFGKNMGTKINKAPIR